MVKGKAQKPTTQGSIEVSHKAFKEALVTWCNKELVWKEETETMVRDETILMDDYEWLASDGSDEDKKPAAKVMLSVETDETW